MSLPVKWWNYTVPGAIIVFSFVHCFVGLDYIKCILQDTKSYEALGSVIVAMVCYVIGYATNVFCVETLLIVKNHNSYFRYFPKIFQKNNTFKATKEIERQISYRI